MDLAGNVGAAVTRRWAVIVADRDGDGFRPPSDCNDADAGVHPRAAEVPGNAVDENCDGIVETTPPDPDGDRDGYRRSVDCDDNNPAVHPGARDVPGNALDEDCVAPPQPALPFRVGSMPASLARAAGPAWRA